jgi:hypothetical protein
MSIPVQYSETDMDDQQGAKTYSDDWDEPQPERAVQPTVLEQPRDDAEVRKPDALAPAPRAEVPEGAGPTSWALVPPAAAAEPRINAVEIPMRGELERFPALFARSAIFRAGRGGADIPQTELACYGEGYSVLFAGPRLDMREKRIFELALRAGKEVGYAGVEFGLSASEITKALRRPLKNSGCEPKPSGPEIDRIGTSLERLARAEIDYRTPGCPWRAARMLGSARETSSGWRVSIDPDLVPALKDDNQFKMNAERRETLTTDLAKWMHDFVSTHKAGFKAGFKLGELAELCGWRDDAGHFSARLAKALEELREKCPELVVGFDLLREKRGALSWRARVDRGEEVADFRCPAKEAESAAKKKSKRDKASRKGGVSL